MATRELEVRYTADTRGFDQATRSVRDDLGQVGKSADRAGGDTRKGLGRASSAIAGFAGGVASQFAGRALDAVANFAAGTVTAASDLGETLNKSNAIFGDQSKAMRDWSKTASTSFGLSQSQALNYAAGLGDMARQLGLTSKESANFGQDLVGVAADLGSFNNLETGDVLERISAAMRGEYDSLQALIPNINAARVEQEALSMTGKDSAKQLTAQEKALAVQAILHKDGARAMGDFAKTSGGFANQQKIVAAQLQDVQAKLGQALLPVLTAVMTFVTTTAIPALSDFVDWFQTGLGPAIGDLAGQFQSFMPQLQAFGGFIADNAQWLVPLAAGIGGVALAVKAWTVAQRVLNTVMRANPIGIVITIIGLLVTAFITAYTQSETFRNIVNGAFNTVKNVVVTVGNAVVGAVRSIIDWLVNTWRAAVDFGVRVVAAFHQVNSNVINAVRDMRDRVVAFFTNLVNQGARLFITIRDRITSIIRGVRDRVVSDVRSLRDRVVAFFTNLHNRAYQIALALRNSVVTAFRRLRDAAISVATQLRDWVVSRVTSLRDRAVNLAQNLYRRVVDYFRNLRTNAANVAGQLRDWVADRVGGLRDRVVRLARDVRDRVLSPFRTLRDKGKEVFASLRDSVGRIMGGLLDKVKGPLRTVFRWLNKNLIGPLDSVTSKFGLNIPDLPKLHSGGYVPGAGERPYMLKAREGVLNPRATAEMGGKRGIDMLNAGGPGDWLRNFTEFIGTPAKLVAEMATRGVKWAIGQVLGAIPNIPGQGVPIVDMVPGLFNNLKDKVTSWASKTEQEQAAVLNPGGGSIGSGPWVKPVAAGIGNGYLGYPGHYGVDFPVGTGTSVHAVSNAIVSKAASLTYSYGRHLFLRHADGLVTVYAHLSRLLAHAGQSVRTGQVIGASGSTGNSTGPHLHFETRVGGGYPGPNPRSVMAARGVTLDTGGFLQPGYTLAYNGTGAPEPVLTGRQFDALAKAKDKPVEIHLHGVIDKAGAASEIRKLLVESGIRVEGVRVGRRTR